MVFRHRTLLLIFQGTILSAMGVCSCRLFLHCASVHVGRTKKVGRGRGTENNYSVWLVHKTPPTLRSMQINGGTEGLPFSALESTPELMEIDL